MTWSSARQRMIMGAGLLGLCACGSASNPGPAATTPAAADRPASSNAPAATTAGSTTGGSTTEAVDSAELCGFLEQEAPRLRAFGPGGTGDAGPANFTLALDSWVEKDPSTRTPRSAEELDTTGLADCPKARTEILLVLESPGSVKAFGG